jgi:hypothetical protein
LVCAGQQRLYFAAEVRVLTASIIQESLPGFRRTLQGGVIELFDFSPPLVEVHVFHGIGIRYRFRWASR